MLREFRHRLVLRVLAGILVSGAIALAVEPTAWRATLICTAGSMLAVYICARIARRYLQTTVGRLRRVAEDIGRGRPAPPLETQPAGDLYKLTAAVNLLATRLTEAREEEARLQEQLRRRERLLFLGELAANVAHEVYNPLDGVQNCVRILRRSADDPQRTAQMLDLIDSGLERIELIVRRLLALGREHPARFTEGRIADIVDGATRLIAPQIDGRGVHISRRFETREDRALVDGPLLEQVFVNLMLNAVDSMPHGGELTVVARREPADAARNALNAAANCALADSDLAATADRRVSAGGDVTTGKGGAIAANAERTAGDHGGSILCVDVADTGTGIPADVLPHIFEPFFTTKPDGKGTGLGLAIAARIVDAHRGTISVTPRAGGGTVFTVRIPALTQGGEVAGAALEAEPGAAAL